MTNSKENFTVKNIHDRDGYTEQEIMEESEIIEAVEKWLKDNSFAEEMKTEGVIRTTQSFGNRVAVQIDTRDGRIITCTEYQNQYHDSDSFFITLASTQELELEECELLGNDDWADITKEQIIETILDYDDEDFETFVESNGINQNENGTYTVSFQQAQDENCMIEVEDWFSLIGKDYDKALDEWTDYMLEDIGEDWENNVSEFYQGLRYERDHNKAFEILVNCIEGE